MIIAVRLTISKIGIGQRSEGSGHNEIHHNSIKCNLELLIYIIELECILNGLLWWRLRCSNAFTCAWSQSHRHPVRELCNHNCMGVEH